MDLEFFFEELQRWAKLCHDLPKTCHDFACSMDLKNFLPLFVSTNFFIFFILKRNKNK